MLAAIFRWSIHALVTPEVILVTVLQLSTRIYSLLLFRFVFLYAVFVAMTRAAVSQSVGNNAPVTLSLSSVDTFYKLRRLQ